MSSKKNNKRYNRQKLNKNKIEKHKNNIIIENDLKKDIIIKKDNTSKYIIITIILLILLLLLSLIVIPRITINNPEISIRYNTKYIDKDYKAKNLFKDYTKKVKIKNNINTKELGDYEVIYSLQFGFITITKKRIVSVVDDVKPNITLKGNNLESVCPNTEYKEQGYEAIDEYDGDLTDKVQVDKTKDKITYKVTDESGNTKKTTRKLIYEDKEKPNITLKGNSSITLYIGSQYIEPGYNATDNCDGDLTNKVQISGTVNTNVTGTYKINYKVKDNNQNESITTRTIIVKNWSVIRPSQGGSGKGIVYLTFDDGPNEGTTNKILDILKEEGVQATFFVTCNGPDYLIKRMHNEGHTVALHTATHNYSYVYSSVNNYFNDLNRVSTRVKNITGIDSKIIRFPGGSSNTISKKTSPGIMTTLTSEVKKRGYKYFDWNVDSNDAAGAGTNAVYNNVTNHISLNRENIVLMHDIKTSTRDAIRNIIKYGKANGFTFKKITMDTVMITHGVNN